jgi:hypothetical protein
MDRGITSAEPDPAAFDRGRGHTIPTIGDAYNSLLDEFLTRVETAHA